MGQGRDRCRADTRGGEGRDRAGARKKSARTARLDLRLTPDEKRRTELHAVVQGVTINEFYARLLDFYEQHHGRVEVPVKERK